MEDDVFMEIISIRDIDNNRSSNKINNDKRFKPTRLIVDKLRNQGLDVEICKRNSSSISFFNSNLPPISE